MGAGDRQGLLCGMSGLLPMPCSGGLDEMDSKCLSGFASLTTLSKLFFLAWSEGWLPCGLVYAALALTLTTGEISKCAITMFSFGLSTLPAVMGIGIITSVVTRFSRIQSFKELIGLAVVCLALMAALPWLNPMVIIITHTTH